MTDREYLHAIMNTNGMGPKSEQKARSVLRQLRANQKIDKIPLGEDTLQPAAEYASIISSKIASCLKASRLGGTDDLCSGL